MEETIILDMSPKGQLLSAMLAQAASDAEATGFRSFIDALTDEQAQKLLALDGFTEPYKIPVWDDEIGGPVHDANKQRDREPDRYIDGTTAPRRIADDLAVLLLGASFDKSRLFDSMSTYGKLDKVNKKYWQRLNEIMARIFLNLPSVGGRKPKGIIIPTDFVVNQHIWNQQAPGSYHLDLAAAIGKSGKQVKTYLTMNFDSLPPDILAMLNHFDEQIYLAISNLWVAGNELISDSMIYSVFNDGRPGAEDIEKIESSMSKMGATQISLNNKEEAENSNYPEYVYKGSLLPIERVQCFINGQFVDEAIHIFREPPCFTYARLRGQVTTIKRELLLSPLNKTENNIHLAQYILRIIGAAKNGSITNKITYKKVFEELSITSPSQKTRTKGYTKRLFEFHKKQGNISSFKEEKDGIRFYWKTSGELQKN